MQRDFLNSCGICGKTFGMQIFQLPLQWVSVIVTLLVQGEGVPIHDSFAVQNCHVGPKIANCICHYRLIVTNSEAHWIVLCSFVFTRFLLDKYNACIFTTKTIVWQSCIIENGAMIWCSEVPCCTAQWALTSKLRRVGCCDNRNSYKQWRMTIAISAPFRPLLISINFSYCFNWYYEHKVWVK